MQKLTQHCESTVLQFKKLKIKKKKSVRQDEKQEEKDLRVTP